MRMQDFKQPFARLSCAACAALFTTSAAGDEEPSQSVAFYVLGLAIDGSVSVGEVAADIDLSASEFFDQLEWGGMGSYRFQQERWSFQLDVLYATLAGQTPAGPRAELDLSMIELDGGYRLNESLEIVIGARGWDYEAQLNVVGAGGAPVRGSRSWTDPLLGARLMLPIGERWELLARADVGGFGVGADFAWHATAALSWRLSDSFGVLFGYRIFDLDIDDDDDESVHADLQHSGPALGVSLGF